MMSPSCSPYMVPHVSAGAHLSAQWAEACGGAHQPRPCAPGSSCLASGECPNCHTSATRSERAPQAESVAAPTLHRLGVAWLQTPRRDGSLAGRPRGPGRALPQQEPASGVVKLSGPGPTAVGSAARLFAGRPTEAALTVPFSGTHCATVRALFAWRSARRCEKGRMTLCAPRGGGAQRLRRRAAAGPEARARECGHVDSQGTLQGTRLQAQATMITPHKCKQELRHSVHAAHRYQQSTMSACSRPSNTCHHFVWDKVFSLSPF